LNYQLFHAQFLKRNLKAEIRKRQMFQVLDAQIVLLAMGFRASGFGLLSDFGFRLSDLETALSLKLGVNSGCFSDFFQRSHVL